jgi:hypothetical protein
MKFWLTIGLLITLSIPAAASPSAWRLCDIRQGKFHSCETIKFTGEAVIPIPQCTVSNFVTCNVVAGREDNCRDYTGSAPSWVKFKYVTCDIQSGYIRTCNNIGFTGKMVLWR